MSNITKSLLTKAIDKFRIILIVSCHPEASSCHSEPKAKNRDPSPALRVGVTKEVQAEGKERRYK